MSSNTNASKIVPVLSTVYTSIGIFPYDPADGRVISLMSKEIAELRPELNLKEIIVFLKLVSITQPNVEVPNGF